MAEKVLQSELRVSAVNATGRVFEQIANKVKGLEGTMKSLRGVTAGFGGIAKTFDKLHHMTRTLAPVAGPAGAYESARAASALARGSVAAVADYQHELARMRAAGMLEPEIKEADDIAQRLSAKYKPVSQTAIMHALRNIRSVVGTFEEASKIADPLLKLRVIAGGAHPEHAAALNEDFDQLIKGMEIKGVTQNLPEFSRYMEGMAKAINVFGDTLRPTDFYEMFKYGRQATQGLSEKFMLSTAPTLAQELGGSSAGKAMSSFFQAMTGKMKPVAANELMKYGLLDKSKLKISKAGIVTHVSPGAVKGHELAASDPYAWVNDVFLPALAKKGVTDPKKIQDLISIMFQQATAAQMVGVFATQQSRIQKDWNLVGGAKGLDAAGIFMEQDPFVAWQGVTNQFTNLLKAAASPLAEPATKALGMLTDVITRLQEAATTHPMTAVTGLLASTALAGGAAVAATSWTFSRMGALLRGGASAAGGAAVATEEAMLSAAWLKSVGAAAPAAGGGWLSAVAGRAALPLTLLSAAQFLHDENEQWAGTTLNERARRARGGGSLRDVYRADFAADRERLGIAKLDGDATVTVKIEGPEWLRAAVSVASDIAGLKIGTSGDTGRSMPEVAPIKYLR